MYERKSIADPHTKTRFLRLALYTGAVLVFLLFALAVAVPMSASPSACGYCHSADASIASWKESSHSRVTCAACHFETSLGAVFKQHLAGRIREAATKTNDGCLRCHSPERRRVTAARGLTMSQEAHLKHLAAGLTCAVCHNRVGHKETQNAGRFNGTDMLQGCFRCHQKGRQLTAENGKKAPAACSTCHEDKKPQPPSHQDPALEPWKEKHGLRAWEDVEICRRCHTPEGAAMLGIPACFDCHGVKLPHDSNWRQIHSESPQDNDPRCRVCHKSRGEDRDFCQQCHHKQFEPNGPWVTTLPGESRHPLVVKAKGSKPCFSHHQPSLCRQCHTLGLDGYRRRQSL